MRERDKYECYGKGDPGQRSGGRYPPEWRKALINAAQEQALRLGSITHQLSQMKKVSGNFVGAEANLN